MHLDLKHSKHFKGKDCDTPYGMYAVVLSWIQNCYNAERSLTCPGMRGVGSDDGPICRSFLAKMNFINGAYWNLWNDARVQSHVTGWSHPVVLLLGVLNLMNPLSCVMLSAIFADSGWAYLTKPPNCAPCVCDVNPPSCADSVPHLSASRIKRRIINETFELIFIFFKDKWDIWTYFFVINYQNIYQLG